MEHENFLAKGETIKRVVISTGNTCNLACITCFPGTSSRIAQFFDPDDQGRKFMSDFDHGLANYVLQNETIRIIEFIGGEPFLSKKMWAFLESLIRMQRAQLTHLRIITNATVVNDKIIETLKEFRSVKLMVSLDGVGATNNYQRWPSKFDELEANIVRLRKSFPISILSTLTAFNITNVHEIREFCQKHDLLFKGPHVVKNKDAILPGNLPKELHHLVHEDYRAFLEFKNESVDIFAYIQEWDQARGARIGDFLPEWQRFDNKFNS